jgi:hypothetical protein
MGETSRRKISMSNQYPPNDPRRNYQPSPYNDETVPYQRDAVNAQSSYGDGGVYRQEQNVNYVDPQGNRVERRQQVYVDRNQSRANTRYWLTRVIYFLLAVLEVIIALRFLFLLLGANQSNGFIIFLYDLSRFFVEPFKGIFNDPSIGHTGVSVFEVSSIVAMLVYALIAWGIVSLVRILLAPVADSRQTFESTRRNY